MDEFRNRSVLLDNESFGPLLPFILDDRITDVDYNGTDLWLTDVNKVKVKAEASLVTPKFLEVFINKVSMAVEQQFNPANPILEAESDELRITAVHETVTTTGRAFCIRKAPAVPRYDAKELIRQGYCRQEILALLVNCVRTKMNFVICGDTGVGKTEFAKFLSGYIRAQDKVITIEDNPEWHYAELYPGNDCIAIKVKKERQKGAQRSNATTMDYTNAIKTCLRLNPSWIMLSEARSKEAKSLLECWSTGVKGITTIHTDNVLKIPDRFMNMIQNSLDADRMVNDIYDFIDIGILLRIKEMADGKSRRYIDQMCFFDRENGQNRAYLIVSDGQALERALPDSIAKKMERAGVTEPYVFDFKTGRAGHA
ncbi:MAG: type II/IV secretion system ATPase subunit [Eubacterium sp.]|nr:type II/IV secretion system ATPase subunit [Eubacterium sp.]